MKSVFRLTIIVVLFAQAMIVLADDESSEKTSPIKWLTGVEQALAEGKSKNKPVLLDFFNPG